MYLNEIYVNKMVSMSEDFAHTNHFLTYYKSIINRYIRWFVLAQNQRLRSMPIL